MIRQNPDLVLASAADLGQDLFKGLIVSEQPRYDSQLAVNLKLFILQLLSTEKVSSTLNRHPVSHVPHAIYVLGKLGHQVPLSLVFGLPTQRHHTILGDHFGGQGMGGLVEEEARLDLGRDGGVIHLPSKGCREG